MSNPLDNKIKESLENFEMPYDAGAWAELEQQLPAADASATGSQFGWKTFGLLAAIVTLVTTAWYLNSENSSSSETVVVEQTDLKNEQVVNEKSTTPEASTTNSDQKVIVEEVELPTPEHSNHVVFEEMPVEENLAPNNSPEKSQKELAANTDESNPVLIGGVELITEEIIEEPLMVKFSPSSQSICVGENINFISESSHKAAMTWEFGDGTSSSETNPVHDYVLPGNYTVTLVGNSGDRQAEYAVSVTVNPTPMPIFSSSKKLDGYVAIPLYRYTTALQPSETALWSFSDGTKIVGNAADHLYREAGKATVNLTVTNSLGCSSTMDESYETQEFNLITPSIFSPNGDGLNELFIPAALPEMGIEFEMSIRNPRTGEVVYKTANANEGWNGNKNNSGTKLETGVYIWTVVLKENVVNNKVFNGKITLKR